MFVTTEMVTVADLIHKHCTIGIQLETMLLWWPKMHVPPIKCDRSGMMKKLEWYKSNAMTRLSTWWHKCASVYFQELCYATMLKNNHINMIFDYMQWIIRHGLEEVQTSKFMELISYMNRVESCFKETLRKTIATGHF